MALAGTWNLFGCWGYNWTEVDVRGIADALVSSGMADAGYTYVNLDSGAPSQTPSAVALLAGLLPLPRGSLRLGNQFGLACQPPFNLPPQPRACSVVVTAKRAVAELMRACCCALWQAGSAGARRTAHPTRKRACFPLVSERLRTTSMPRVSAGVAKLRTRCFFVYARVCALLRFTSIVGRTLTADAATATTTSNPQCAPAKRDRISDRDVVGDF